MNRGEKQERKLWQLTAVCKRKSWLAKAPPELALFRHELAELRRQGLQRRPDEVKATGRMAG